MVRSVPSLLLLILLTGFVSGAWAAPGTLDIHVDRDTLHENQTLTMRVQGEMPFSMDLDMLFNIGDADLPSPDEDALKQNFEILSRHQKYSLRSVNGDATAVITWIYELAPKTTGQLTIPSLTFRDAHSSPVTITVKPGDAPSADGDAPPAFVEVETDKDSVYVQEQLVLTVRLFYRGNLIRGDLSQPDHGDAIIETMGEQQEYARIRNNVRYRVVERRYVIYPQTPGNLTIDGITFNGQARDDRGQLNFLRDRANPVDIPVKDIPAQFTGDTWLPATSLELEDQWSGPSQQLEAGKSVTRTIRMKALGLLGSALPPMDVNYPDSLRSYPDKAEMTSDVNDRTVTSSRTENTALVAIKPGEITLPEIRVPWWDTVNDRQRVAVIPARTLSIANASGQVPSQPPAPETAAQTSAPASAPADEASDNAPSPPVTAGVDRTWFWLALALGTGWVLTLLFWWLNRRRDTGTVPVDTQPDAAEAALFADLQSAAGAGSAQTLSLLPRWARRRFASQHLRSAADVVRFSQDEVLGEELEKLQERLYSDHQSTGEWHSKALQQRLEVLRESHAARPEKDALAPLYPAGLKASRAGS
ncbi:BatD family protein [Marinobacter sp. JSM 1782161]|uniref:BatD family protein n=1 Tax=Marinobacter sp. JSM 1782161 TaxID=2685906 RepID=UPI001403519E|nr:BatD family protein [Marinobacter sp. JSM 1782161]